MINLVLTKSLGPKHHAVLLTAPIFTGFCVYHTDLGGGGSSYSSFPSSLLTPQFSANPPSSLLTPVVEGSPLSTLLSVPPTATPPPPNGVRGCNSSAAGRSPRLAPRHSTSPFTGVAGEPAGQVRPQQLNPSPPHPPP